MKKVAILLIIFTHIFSCAPSEQLGKKSEVRIKMPESDRSKRTEKNLSRLNKSQRASKIFPGPKLSMIDDVDCYVVSIAYQGFGACSGEVKFNNVKIVSNTVSDGGEVIINEVPTSIPLTFYVLGFSKGELASCPDFRTLDMKSLLAMGAPSIVGKVATQLEPIEENIVPIKLKYTSGNNISQCGGAPFDWKLGGVFGTARFGQSRFAP